VLGHRLNGLRLELWRRVLSVKRMVAENCDWSVTRRLRTRCLSYKFETLMVSFPRAVWYIDRCLKLGQCPKKSGAISTTNRALGVPLEIELQRGLRTGGEGSSNCTADSPGNTKTLSQRHRTWVARVTPGDFGVPDRCGDSAGSKAYRPRRYSPSATPGTRQSL
jgi:hypothetical protein